MIENDFGIDIPNNNGENLLMIYLKNVKNKINIDIIMLLFEIISDVNDQDKFFNSILHILIGNNCLINNLGLYILFMEKNVILI